MDFNRTGAPKTTVYKMTPTSKGTKYPCEDCKFYPISCDVCYRFKAWFSEKWADIQTMFETGDKNEL